MRLVDKYIVKHCDNHSDRVLYGLRWDHIEGGSGSEFGRSGRANVRKCYLRVPSGSVIL